MSVAPQPDPELLERLARLGVRVGVPPDSAGRRTAAIGNPARMALEEALPGHWRDTPRGPCYQTTLRRGALEEHGRERLGSVRLARPAALAALSGEPSVAALDPATAVYLDTETTGLNGSAATFAFAIGVGRFEGESFVVRQLLLTGPQDEPAALAALDEEMEGASGLITFNGRTYDVPLLLSRFGLHRMRTRLTQVPHLDLLPPARRLWGRRVGSCALVELERRLLGLARYEDLPGWLIPERYHRFLRDGDARGLVGIFKHNALDVLTMAALAALMARVYDEPESQVSQGTDWLSLAALYERQRDHGRAAAAWERALGCPLPAADMAEALWRLSLAAKRLGNWERASELWLELSSRPAHAGPLVELAKYHEHRLRRPTAAAGFTRQARDLIASGRLERHRRRAALGELDRRLRRLEGRARLD